MATLFLSLTVPLTAIAQLAGSRGGVDASGYPVAKDAGRLPVLAPDVAQAYVTIDGVAEVRVRPT